MFKSYFNCRVKVVHEIVHGLELFGSPKEDKKMSIHESFPEGDCPVKGFPDGFSVMTHEEVGIWWGGLGSH